MLHTRQPTFEIFYGAAPTRTLFDGLNFNLVGVGTGVKLCEVTPMTNNTPILIEVMVEIETAFNAATTNVLTVYGIDQDSNTIVLLAAADVTEGTVGFYPANAGLGKTTFAGQNLTIYAAYTQTGTAATTGAARVHVTLTPYQQAQVLPLA